MTRNDDTTDTMDEVSHTNPYTGETAGQLFSRGPIVVTDGGEPGTTDTDDDRRSERTSTDTMADVDHTPPNDAEDANRVFERGGEPTDVEDAE